MLTLELVKREVVVVEGKLLDFGKACPGQIKVPAHYALNLSKAEDCREQGEQGNEGRSLQCSE